ncbi:MAG TPA: acireductone synthase, partial [Candidatus Acidoferrales bacterium]|nr:acireductone synthase [Candidatus Acidoferrales bacterium]
LKSLQGKIWEAGYRSGELRGRVYPDVAPALARWRAQQRRIAIFSSGSVLAQRLLFSHSTVGDQTPYIGFYFDITTGPKQEQQSYLRIAAALGLPPADILFLSDAAAELDAACRAGMHTALCVRSGPAAPASASHPSVKTFDEVFPE